LIDSSRFSSSNDGTAFYSYDDRDQLTGEFYVPQYVDATGAFQPVASGGYAGTFQPNITYQYDVNGNRLRRAEVDLPVIFDPSDAVNFAPVTQYEPLGDSTNAETFTNGVTVTSTDDFDTPTGTHNRLDTDGTFNYAYDGEGNRISKTRIAAGPATDKTVEYSWDVRNRLTKATFKDETDTVTKTVEFDYDLQDRRIGKRVDADGDGVFETAERYVYDSTDIVLVYDDSENLQNRYLHGNATDQLFADEDGLGEVLWNLSDNLGTNRDWVSYDDTTDTSSVFNHLTYDAFGNITSQSNAGHVPLYAFTGREWDPDVELYYYRARWFDPTIGQFLSADPIKDDANNTYRYVNNSPTNGVDPTGLEGNLQFQRCISCHNPIIMNGGSLSDLPPSFQRGARMALKGWTDEKIDRHLEGIRQQGRDIKSGYLGVTTAILVLNQARTKSSFL